MTDFISAIPAAASSPYALAAYAFCAVTFVLAGARLRTVQQTLKAIAAVPPSDRRHVIESLTGSVIPEKISAEHWLRNNRNRWLFLLASAGMILVSVVAILVVSPRGELPSPPPPPPIGQAREAARQWLAIVDGGRFSEAYADMYPPFRRATSESEWLEKSRKFRVPLGAVESRIEAAAEVKMGSAQQPIHGSILMFVTKFEKVTIPIREFVSLASPGTETPWSVAGYNVDIPLDLVQLDK